MIKSIQLHEDQTYLNFAKGFKHTLDVSLRKVLMDRGDVDSVVIICLLCDLIYHRLGLKTSKGDSCRQHISKILHAPAWRKHREFHCILSWWHKLPSFDAFYVRRISIPDHLLITKTMLTTWKHKICGKAMSKYIFQCNFKAETKNENKDCNNFKKGDFQIL